MAQHKLVGQNYTTPDHRGEGHGEGEYAEDFRAEGMLFAKLLLSPMPHARVLRIDTSAAEAMPGVKAILTVNDLPGAQAGAEIAENVRASAITERGLTMEPMYEGEPILAVAAVDELTAAEADREDLRSNTNRCRSRSIQSRACVPAARTRGRPATCGCVQQRLPPARRRRRAGAARLLRLRVPKWAR